MARLPETVLPSVAPSEGGAPYQRIAADASSFGGAVGTAFRQVGEGVEKLGTGIGQIAAVQQERFNQVATDDAFTQLQTAGRALTFGDPNDPTKKGYLAMQGREALDAFKPKSDELETTRKRIRDGLSNDAQRVEFDTMSRRWTGSTLDGMARHADQQSRVWGATVQKAAETNAVQDIANNYNNPQQFSDLLEHGRDARVRHLQEVYGPNVSPDVVRAGVAEFTSHAVKGRVLAWGAASPAEALQWLQNGTLPQAGTGRQIPVQQAVDPLTYETLVQHLKPKANSAMADGVADREWGGGGAQRRFGPNATADDRSDEVRDEFIKLGYSPAVATGFAANAVQESGAQAAPKPGDGGISHGLFQWNKERHAAFRAKYGVDPEQASVQQQVEFAHHELNTTEGKARAAIVAAQTPEDAAKAISTQFLRPKDTAAEEPRRAAIATRLGRRAYRPPGEDAGTNTAPDMSRMTQNILDMHLDPEVEHAALARLSARHNTWQMTTATQRDTITRQFTDTKLALEAGKDDVEIPATQIRSVFPPARAEDMIQELQVSRMAGQLFKGVQWGTPEDIASARSDLATGQGRLSAMLRLRGKRVEGGGEKAEAAGAEDTPEQFGMRQRMLAKFDQQIRDRQTALERDSAGYVESSPVVQAAVANARANPSDPAASQAIIQATLTAQAQLGVPEYNRRILSNAVVDHMVKTIASVDPATGDIGAQLDQMAKSYGPHWNQAFGELVRVGKLPPEAQTLATMTAPGQVSARQDMQRAMQMVAQHGGLEKLKAAAPQAVVTEIDRNVDASLNAFRTTTSRNEGGADLFATVKSSVKLLAYRYAFQGQSASEALENAVKGVIDAKYDMSGTMRVPKGMLPQVEDATDMIQRGLTGADLADIPGNPRLSQEERQQEVATAVRRGSWVPNADDSGLVLMMPLASGMRTARRRDGSAVEVKFDNLPTAPARAPTFFGSGGDPGLADARSFLPSSPPALPRAASE